MKADQALKLLTELRAEAATLPPSTSSAEFNSWQQRTRSDLTRALGESHHITERDIGRVGTLGARAPRRGRSRVIRCGEQLRSMMS